MHTSTRSTQIYWPHRSPLSLPHLGFKSGLLNRDSKGRGPQSHFEVHSAVLNSLIPCGAQETAFKPASTRFLSKLSKLWRTVLLVWKANVLNLRVRKTLAKHTYKVSLWTGIQIFWVKKPHYIKQILKASLRTKTRIALKHLFATERNPAAPRQLAAHSIVFQLLFNLAVSVFVKNFTETESSFSSETICSRCSRHVIKFLKIKAKTETGPVTNLLLPM